MHDLSDNVTIMIKAARLAGQSLLQNFKQLENLKIETKAPGQLVSQADRDAENIIVTSLRNDRPEWGFLGEEGTDIIGADARYRWIIDPLDGTSNFLHGLPIWCVMIALEMDGQIIAGVILNPNRDELFYAEKGTGAFLNGLRLRVTQKTDIETTLLASEVWGRKHPLYAHYHGGNFPFDTRTFGCAGLAGAYFTAGPFDACYCLGIQPWDIAALVILMTEAGAIATDMSLKTMDHMQGDILAANPVLHAQLATLLTVK